MAYSAITLTTSNSKTKHPNKYSLKLSNDLTLKDSLVSLTHCSIYYTWRNVKSMYNNNTLSYKHKPSNKTHDITIPDGSYSIDDLSNYIHFTMVQNSYAKDFNTPSGIRIYANPVFNRVTISVSEEFELNLGKGLAHFLGFDSSQFSITNTEVNGALKPNTERVHNVIINCNLAQNDYNNSSNTLFTFTPDQSFGTLLSIKPNYPLWTSCRNASFSDIEVWFTDQDNRPLEIEDNVTVTLHIKNI